MKIKVKGFTLVELIVVIAIIGILAAILIPSMMGYARNARAREYNSNARSVNSGAQLAMVDITTAGGEIPAQCIFTGGSDGIAYAEDGSYQFSLKDYLGDDFKGNFAFITDIQGNSCDFALWSNTVIPTDAVVQMSEKQVKKNINSELPIGCHPLIPPSLAEENDS